MLKNDNTTTMNNLATSSESRAQRLRRLRNLANLSRKEMCERSGIKPDTLIGWEVARHGGLSESGARRIVDYIQIEGVKCSIEWLLFGIGEGPSINHIKDINYTHKKTTIASNEDKQIIDELLFFKNHHDDALDYIITDDSMAPHYNQNDYIAGIKRYKDKLHTVIGHDCITQTIDGNLFFRKVLSSDGKNKYNLIATNLNSQSENLILQHVVIAYAAPIIWHRRRNTF